MTARRQSLRLRLALGTALAGGTLVLALPARAQTLPQDGNVIVPALGTVIVNGTVTLPGATINPTPSTPPATPASTLDIGVTAATTVINWNSFNVVGASAAAPATVNFRQALIAPTDSTTAATVINRVTGGGSSSITNGNLTTFGTLGDASTRQNTTLWLLNPNGVLIGGGGVVNAGAFMGSTLDICGTPDCSDGASANNIGTLNGVILTPDYPTLRLFGAPASSTAVRVTGTGRVTTARDLVIVGGAVEVQADARLSADGTVNLVAATDVRVSSAGSPLVYQIAAGSQVAGTLLTTAGTVTGANVVVAAARPTGLAEALLSIGGTVTANGVGVGNRGVVLLGGTGQTDPAASLPDDPTPDSVITIGAAQAGPVGITSTAELTATARNVLVNATGAVTIGGTVTAGADYRVAGATVTLGNVPPPPDPAPTVVQAADGALYVRTSSGDLTGLGNLQLRSNSNGEDGGALTLSSAGAIAFAASTSISGGTAVERTDIRVAESSATTATSFGAITGRSFGRIPTAVGETAPLPLTLYGTTTLGAVSVDRALDLTVLTAGATTGSLTATSIATGVTPLDDTTGTATADALTITTDGFARFGSASSATGSVTVTARDGDVTGLVLGGVTGAANLSAAVARTADTGILAVNDGNVSVYAGRSSAGALTATGTNGLALLGTVTAGNDVTVLAQKVDAVSVQAAAVSSAPPAAGAASGTALLHAYAHDATAGAVDLRVGSVSAGTGSATRPGLDVLLTADATDGTVSATTLNADRDVTVVAGSGANGVASIVGDVLAGRVDGAGAYAVTGGTVALGVTGATVQQSAAGAVTIRSTATDITGLGTLTLQSNSNGIGNEALTLNATRAIAFGTDTRLFAGNGTGAGNSDLLVAEGTTATATSFGQVRARSLGGIPVGPATAPVPLTLYGPTTFGTVDLDRSLTLTIANGGGGAAGTLTTDAVRLGVNPVDGGSGTATADNLVLTTASSARLLSATSRTGSVSITATDGDVTGLSNGAGFNRVDLAAARAATGTPGIADGNVGVYAGRSSAGALTATGTNGLALLGTVTAGNDVTVLAQKIDANTVAAGAVSGTPPTGGAASGTATLHAYAHDATAGAVDLRVGSVSAGAGNAAAPGLDVLLTADATNAVLTAGTLSADRNVTVVAGSGANGVATVSGDVLAGRVDAAGAYGVTAGAVTLGATGSTVQQSAAGAVTIRSTATAITGLGTLTLQSGSDGIGNEALTLNATRAIAFGADTRLFAGNGTGAGNSDLLVAEGTTATATSFGQVRARSLGGIPVGPATAPVPLTLYGPTTFGTVDLDRSLTLTIANGPGGEPGALTTGAVTLGVNPVDGGAGIATADNLVLTTASSARLLSATSRTGSVSITATDGDVTGLSNGAGFNRVDLAAARAATGTPGIADGNVGVYAGRSSAGTLTATGANGLALLGTVTAGNDVTVLAQKIDANTVAAGAVSGTLPIAGAPSGTATLHAYAHDATAGAVDLRVGSVSAVAGSAGAPALDVLLTADAANAVLTAGTLSADRNVTVVAGSGANGVATVSGDVLAGRVDTTGAYDVTAGAVTLGSGSTAAAQSARGAVSIRATATDITGSQRLTLRSNSGGVADGTGAAAGTRTLTLDAVGAIDLALPDGLTVPARDAVATRLIGGSDAEPRRSAIYVRAGSGSVLTLGNVSARSLRSIGPTPVATDFPDFAARAGAQPLYHDGPIRIGSVDTAESLGIFAYTAGAGGNVLLQLDSARSRTGNVELVASGELRGYQLTAPGGSTPLGVYVATDLTSDIGRVDTRTRAALLDDVSAGGFAGLTTFDGRLRVDTVTTSTSLPIADSGIALNASTDIRLTSAIAAQGNVLVQANGGSVTGLPSPDNGTVTTTFAAVSRIEAANGNLTVNALGTAAGSGLIAAATLIANSNETPGAGAPVRGNLSATGQQVGIGTATAGLGSLTLQAPSGGLATGNTGVVLGTGSAGTTATITVTAGSLSALGDGNGSAVIGSLTAGTNLRSGTTTALAGNIVVGTDANIRAGTIASGTGNVTLTARDGGVTGVASGGSYGRVDVTAATARAAAGSDLAVANGSVGVYAGRDSAGALTATGANGLALLGAVAAGGDVTVLAQAIDATSAASANGAILARAYAADAAVTGSAPEALALGTGSAGLGITLEAPAGSVRAGTAAGTVTAGRLRTGVAGNAAITAANTLRLGTIVSETGNVTATARNGNVTGLSDGAGGFGRATLTAAFAAPAAGGNAAVADGNVAVYAGRDSAGALTATGSNGLARLNAATAGGNVTILAQAIDAVTADAARGAVAATAYAADGAIPASGGEALVLLTAGSGLATTLTAPVGSVRTDTVVAGRLTGSVGNAVIDAALDIRARSVTSQTGDVTATARDGDLTGLAAGSGFGRADLAASAATGNVNLYAGRSSAGAQTATGTNGLALLGTVAAGRNLTVLAQAIDATGLAATNGTVLARAYAADGAIPGSAAEALAVGTASSGLGTLLNTPVGSVRAGTVTAGTLVGSVGDATVDSALNIRAGTIRSQTGVVTATARNGNITGLAAGGGTFGRANFVADAATGDIGLYAGRDPAGVLTATGAVGLAQIGTVRAGRNVTIRAQAIDGTSAEAVNGALTAVAYAADGAVTGAGTDALILGEGLSGLATSLTAPAGSVRAGSVIAGRLTGSVGDATLTALRTIRAGTIESRTGIVTATAREGSVTGLAAGGSFGRANFIASAPTGDVAVYAGRDSTGALTATGNAGLALLGTARAGRNVTVLAQAIDATRLEATNGTVLGRAYAADGAVTGSAAEALAVDTVVSGLGTTLNTPAGSIRAGSVTAGTVTGSLVDAVIDSARNIRAGLVQSQTRNVIATARDGDITGLASGAGFGRADFTASAASGDVGAFAGRDASGALTATGTAGLARLGTVTAGRNVTIRAQAIDATKAEAIGGTLTARAYAADGAVPGSGTEALILGEGLSALATSLTASAGSVRADSVIAGRLAGSVGDATIEAQRNVRAGTVRSQTGNVTATAREGDVTGVATAGVFGRASFVADAAAANVGVYAGRDTAGAPTAVGNAGLARLDTVSAGGTVTILAQAVDALTLDATNGAVAAQAFAADGAVAGSATEALAIVDARSGLGTTLTAPLGSVRAGLIDAGRRTGSVGDVLVDAARNVRLDTGQTATGRITVTARNGDLTGLLAGGSYGRATLAASAPTGDIALYAGRNAAGAQTATGVAGLALIDSATASRDLTIRAQAIDALRLETVRGAVTAQAYAPDATIAGRTGEALIVTEMLSALGSTLTASAGSVRADAATTGRATGSVGDAVIDAARNVRTGTIESLTGSITATARDGDVTGLATATGYDRALLTAGAATGDVNVYAGRSAAGTLTATGNAGLALIGTATAGRNVTIGAQAIDATTAEAINGTLTARAYAADGAVAGSAGDALVLVEGRSGLDTLLATTTGSVRATGVTAGTLVGSVGNAAIDSALNVRVGTVVSQTGNVGVIARGGDLTGLDTGSGYGRAILTASAASGDVAAYAGRDSTGTLTATGSAGLALIGTATAGRNVTLGAQAADITRAQAINGTLTAQAYAADGAVAGSAGDALVIAESLSGLGTALTTSAGSVRVTTATAGTLAGSVGTLAIDSARNVRVGTGLSNTGNVSVIARDGDLTGLDTGSGFARAILTASAATGDVGAYAGRDASGALTATGAAGLALIDTVAAGRNVAIGAQAIDVTRAEATGGMLTAQAYAGDGAVAGGPSDALVLAEGLSGLGTTLITDAGSVRATTLTAGTLAAGVGDVAVDAALSARLGTVLSNTGSIGVIARDGDVTGLAAGAGYGRALLTANGTNGDIGLYAGRDTAGALTASGSAGLVLVDTATAVRDVAIAAQAIDAMRLEATGGAIAARAYAADGAVPGSGGEALVVVDALSGLTTSLTTAVGSVQASTVTAGGDALVDSALNLRIGTALSQTGNVDVIARGGDLTGLDAGSGYARAILTAAATTGNVTAYAGTDSTGAPTAIGSAGLAFIDTVTAGNDVTIGAQAIDVTRAEATGGALTARAYGSDGAVAGSAGDALVLAEGVSGLGTTLATTSGSVRATTVTAGTLAGGVGDLAIDAAGDVRIGTGLSQTGNVGVIARGGDLTGLATGSGFGRAILTASATSGDVNAYAGRDAGGALTAVGNAGLALIDTVSAGRNVTVGAQATDITRAEATGGTLTVRAYAADGTVAGVSGEALVLAEGVSGLGTTLATTTGSVRADTVTSGRLAGSIGGATIDSARNVRVGTVRSQTGSVRVTARDGDVTGLAGATGYTRAILAANAATGDVGVYAGRDLDGVLTATTGNGLALIDTATAGRDVTVKAQAIDATRLQAGRTILGQAWAADGAAPATGVEALVVVDAASGQGTTLTSFGGSVRSSLVDAGLAAGATGDIAIDAARDVRVGTARTALGSVVVTARDGAVTGLANASGFDRTVLTAAGATGDLRILAGRDAAGVQTATGSHGLAYIDTATAGRDVTIGAQAIDATTMAAGRALAARAFAADGVVTGSLPDALTVVTATAGQGASLTSAGSIRTTTAAAGQLRTGVTGDLTADAARNVTIETGTSTTGNVTVTARDGTVAATTLTAAVASTAAGADAAIADGNVAVYAGRDAAGGLTASAGNGLAQLGTVTAGNDVTVRAQKIAAGSVQAAAVSATPLGAGPASGTATLVAYGHDATLGATDLSVTNVAAGTGTGPRRGLDVVLTANAADATLNATTINADRNVTVSAGSGSNGAAAITGQVRAGLTDASGGYAVTAGQVTLGTAGTAIEQSAPGAVAITSTATDILGLGTLTLQSNSDGTGRDPLALRAARGIVLPATSRLFGGTDTAAGTSDILVSEGTGATLTTFGEVRGRSLGGIPTGSATAPVPLTLYGATTFGTVNLDRSLDLTVANGGGGAPGTLTTGPLLVGRYPASGVADNITIRTSGTARFASIRSATGGVSVTTTGTGQSIVSDAGIDAVNAILLNAAGDVTTTTVTSSAGRVQLDAGGTASGQTVTASGGAIDVTAGARAQYATLTARDAITVGAGSIGVGAATAGSALTMTASGADTGAADGEALVLGTGSAGNTAALTGTTGSVRATAIDAGQARNGTLGNLTITAARSVRVETGTSGTGNTTVTARDGTVAATTLRAAVASAAQGSAAAVTDGSVAVYAGRDASGVLTATGSNGLAQLGTVSAGNNVTVLAQKIAAGTVQAAEGSATASATGTPSGTATLTAYAHDTTADAVDLIVGSVSAGTGTTARRGLDVVLAANASGGTLVATTINADRNVSVTAGTGTNGTALVSGAVRAGRVDPAGTYAVRAGSVTLGTAGQTVEQSAAAATSITATAGNVTGLGTLTLQSNRDGTGAEALEVRAAGGSVLFDPASTLRGGQAAGAGSNVTVAATGGTAANIDIGTLGAVGSTATLQADGSITTRGPLTAGTAALTAAGTITTNGAVTAPTLTMQSTAGITANGAIAATTATLQSGAGITINGALSATTANLRAVGRATTTAPITATTLTVQSSQIALGSTVTGTTVGLYNQATATNATRLGGAASATDTAYDLDEAEFGRITAGTLTIGSGADDTSGQPLNSAWVRQNVQIGKLAIANGTGSTTLRVVGTGPAQTVTVNGAVTMNGGTANRAPSTRVLQLGGAATSTAGEVGRILLANDGAATGNTGSIATGGAVLDLRGGQILAGKQAYIDEVLAAGTDVGRTFVSNPNSSLYGAGPNGYLISGTPIELVTTGQLKLQFSNVALFQNTSRPGAIPTGVTITGASSSTPGGQPLVLRSGSSTLANGFALFGRFQPSPSETFFSTQAALLGPTFISNGATGSNGVNPSSARLNGCLISSASGGCLASSIAQPSLNVFDVTRDQVLRGSDNLVVTFDPLVGSNNEALFGDIAAGDTFDLQRCPDGTVSAQCQQSGDPKQ